MSHLPADFHRRFEPALALTQPAARPQEPAPVDRLSPFDAVARAMDKASLLAGAVAMNDTHKADAYAQSLRSHLIKYIYPQEPAPRIVAAQEPAESLCQCKDRPASQCPGEWEPGCDLGANPKFVKVHQQTPQEMAALDAALGIVRGATAQPEEQGAAAQEPKT